MHAVVEGITDALFVKDRQGRYLMINSAGASFLGKTIEGVVGKYDTDLFSPETALRIMDVDRGIMATGETRTLEQVATAAGITRTFFETKGPYRDRDGNIAGVIGIARDITERKAAEEKLRLSERRLAEAQRVAHIGSWERDLRDNQITWSDELYRLFGFRPQECAISYEQFLKLVGKQEADRLRTLVDQALREHRPFSTDIRISLPDGRIRILHDRGEIILDDEDRPIRLVGTAQDVTELRGAEQALRESEERCRLALDVAALGTWRHDFATHIVHLDARAQALWGFDRAYVETVEMQALFHPEDQDRILMEFAAAVAAPGGNGFASEFRIIRPDGDVRWIALRARLYFTGEGAARHVIRSIGTYLDITERKRAEEALQASESELRAFIDHATDAFYLFDESAILLDVNRQACDDLGYTRDELIGKTPHLFDPDVTPAGMEQIAARLRAGELVAFDARHRRKDGSIFPVEVRLRPITLEGRRYALSLVRNITDRKRAEAALRESAGRLQNLSHRLLEVQESERRSLARELHDEIGQHLTGLKLLLEPHRNFSVDEAGTRFEQAQSIVGDLLKRVRGLSFDLRPAALDQLGLVPALVTLFERHAELTGLRVNFKHTGVEGRFAPEIETAAYRIIQEGLTNVARHAKVSDVAVLLWATAQTLSLQIHDRGRGFDLEVAAEATRSSGLAGMQERVTLLQGQLTIESLADAGTRITAELPLQNRTAGQE